MTNFFDDSFDESVEPDNIYEIEETTEETPKGGLVLQILDYRGQVEDIIEGLEDIKKYIAKLEVVE